MIFRRYGTSFQSVETAFDGKALNEVGFRRDHKRSIPVEEVEASFETVKTVELTAEATGSVQSETEQQMLDSLRAQVGALLGDLGEGQILVVENEQGHDHPKPRQETKNVIVAGENRLHFEYTLRPPLRVSTRQPKG
jgi:hypothetical protein